MNNIKLISIDHGNKNMKVLGEKESNNKCFSSGYIESDTEPISKENLLFYSGKYYSVDNNRFPVIFDKSSNEKFFILTLAAIAHALKGQHNQENKIIISCGLPISSYSILKDNFRQYLMEANNIEYNFEGMHYKFSVEDCLVYPQGYSSYLTVFNDFKEYKTVCCDIGGYTADVFNVDKGGKLDVGSATSINEGVITLFRDIKQELLKHDIRINESQIEETIKGSTPIMFDDKIVGLIDRKAKEYTENLISKLREFGMETKVNPMLCIGGGANLLRKQIEQSNNTGYVEFLDQYANCRGYQLLAKKALEKGD